jgi:hypothetical protein
VVWSEALRNPALAAGLRDSFDAAGQALAETVRASSPAGTRLAPDVLAKTLLCLLSGYLLQLAIRGSDAVAPIPDAVRELFPAAG